MKTIRESQVSVHEEALRRLCFVCTKILAAKERRNEVEKFLDMLSKGLNCTAGIFSMEGITPIYFCQNCRMNLDKVAKGKSITTNRRLVNWEECGLNCNTCALLLEKQRKRGGGNNKNVSEIYSYSIHFLSFIWRNSQSIRKNNGIPISVTLDFKVTMLSF